MRLQTHALASSQKVYDLLQAEYLVVHHNFRGDANVEMKL